MKKLIWTLLLIPTLVLGQGRERFQKESFRSGGSMGSMQSPRMQNYEYSQKQQFRNPPSSGGSNNYYYYGNPYYYNDWWYGGRWPYYYGYNYYYPYYWYDSWGYRNPARVYVKDGVQDTVKITVPTTILGFTINTNKELGGWITVGRKNYFIMEYSHSYQIDASTYYTNITINDAVSWNDKRLRDQRNTQLFSLGAGTHIQKNLSVYGQYGFASTVVRNKYYDELRVLSNNGQYSFPYSRTSDWTIKVGAIYYLNKSIFKFDADIVRQVYSLGLGIKL